jgi:hypothetical protein
VRRDRQVKLALRVVNLAQIAVGRGIERIQRQRPADQLNGAIILPKLVSQEPQQVQRIHMVGKRCEKREVRSFRFGEPPLVVVLHGGVQSLRQCRLGISRCVRGGTGPRRISRRISGFLVFAAEPSEHSATFGDWGGTFSIAWR